MKRLIAALLMATSLIAGCTTSAATPSPAAKGTPSATATPSVAPTPTAMPSTKATPAPSPIAASAHVTFDGKKCAYSGPRILTSPAALTVTFAPSPAYETARVQIYALADGTTDADLHRYDNDPQYGVGGVYDAPPFVYWQTSAEQIGTSTKTYELPMDGFMTYSLLCLAKIPGHPATDEMTIIKLLAPHSTASASPTAK